MLEDITMRESRNSTVYSILLSIAQTSYLPWLEHTGVNAGELEACDDCSSGEIQLPVDVPFGNYYHSSIYVSAQSSSYATFRSSEEYTLQGNVRHWRSLCIHPLYNNTNLSMITT